MKKIIKQDGVKRVFILDDGKEIPFDNITIEEKKEKKEIKEQMVSLFKKEKINNE